MNSTHPSSELARSGSDCGLDDYFPDLSQIHYHPAPMRQRLLKTSLGIIVTFGLFTACSKENPAPAPAPDATAASAPSSAPSVVAPVVTTEAAAAPSASASTSVVDLPAGPTACPSITEWSRLSGFASDCSYMWTKTAADLPKPPEWTQCDVKAGDPLNECKRFVRTGTIEALTAGANLSGKTQIGFVENCPQPQIVIADADGPTRFAMRSTLYSGEPSACMLKILAVDLGRWVAALGGSQASDDPEYGKCVGNAFVGGNVGNAPNIMQFQTKSLYDVRDASGYLTSEGWFAGQNKKRWNGKDFESVAPFDYQFLTGKVLATAKRGIFIQADPTPQLLVDTPEERELHHFRRRDKQVAWLEELYNVKKSTCWLVVGDVDKGEMLTKVRRVGKVPCAEKRFEIGCNSAFIGAADGLYLASLVDGSTRKLDLKAEALSVECQEVFVRYGTQLLRIPHSAFGAPEPAAEPSVDLPFLTPATDLDGGVPDAAAPDASAAAPASSLSK